MDQRSKDPQGAKARAYIGVMHHIVRLLAAAAVIATGAAAVYAAEFSVPQKDEIGQIVREYLLKNPELLRDVMQELERKQAAEASSQQKTALAANARSIFHEEGDLTAGNKAGNVTMVEFFDYNCGYCKRAFPDVMKLIGEDKELRLVMKEFPILGPGSNYASRAALASRKQGKYWEFHLALLGHDGHVDEPTVLEIAQATGLDVERLKRDMESEDVQQVIDRNMKLATELNIQGTPAFIVDQTLIPGAIGYQGLASAVQDVREAGGCKLC